MAQEGGRHAGNGRRTILTPHPAQGIADFAQGQVILHTFDKERHQGIAATRSRLKVREKPGGAGRVAPGTNGGHFGALGLFDGRVNLQPFKVHLFFNRKFTAGCERFWWLDPTKRRSRAGLLMLTGIEKAAAAAGCHYWMMISLDASEAAHAEAIYLARDYKPVERIFLKQVS